MGSRWGLGVGEPKANHPRPHRDPIWTPTTPRIQRKQDRNFFVLRKIRTMLTQIFLYREPIFTILAISGADLAISGANSVIYGVNLATCYIYIVEQNFQKLQYSWSADFLIQAVFYHENKFWTIKRPLAFMTEARKGQKGHNGKNIFFCISRHFRPF